MPLIDEPFFPQPRDSHGFVQFGIVLSLSAVHQWAQDTLFLGPLLLPDRWKSRNHPALVWSRSEKPARAATVLQGSASEIAAHAPRQLFAAHPPVKMLGF